MKTIVLNSEGSGEALKELVDQVASGDIQICDESGKILAYLTAPSTREDRLYAEAEAEAVKDRDILLKRSANKGGITTEELCVKVGMPYGSRTGKQGASVTRPSVPNPCRIRH